MDVAPSTRPVPFTPDSPRVHRRGFALALTAITLLALGLRLYRLDFESLWMDEVVTVETYHYPPIPLIQKAADLGQPPLDNFVGAVSARVGLADSDWWVRFPAAAFGTGAVVLLGLLLRRLRGDVPGLIAALLLAVCPLHQYLSQEARPYAIFVFFGLATVLAYLSARDRNCLRAWSVFGGLLFLTLMTRWTDPHFLTGGLIAFSVLARVRAGSDSAEKRRFRRMAAATAVAYAVYAPFFWVVLLHSPSAVGAQATALAPRVLSQLSIWFLAVFHGYSTRTVFSALSGPSWLIALASVLASIGLIAEFVRTGRPGRSRSWFVPVALLPFPIVYALVFCLLGNAVPKPQYLLFGVIALFSLMALGIDAIRTGVMPWNRRLASLTGIALALVLVLPMTRATWASLQRADKQDWRGMMTYLKEHAGTKDAYAIIATDSIPSVFHVAAYGRSRYGPREAKFLGITLKTDPTALSAEPWTREGNVLWLAGYTDRRYTGRDEIPPPRIAGAKVHEFEGLFLIEFRGSGSATSRLLDALSEIYEQLPEGRLLVAPAMLAAKFEAGRGSTAAASRWLRIAAAQCRDRVELGLLERDWIAPLQATLESPLRVEHHTRADQGAGPAQPLTERQSLVE